ncbi:Ig-like domain-containing protein [Brucepastera parasyntrophica]|uniref:Ig-like domain-containing protein n=1 Tax=Brucepastera parasyntrophica TaxID=2880008 RepID=UPI002109A74D|nr:Ig-like domain-containing protein [Brucepastera parasyntrophica]ULQ59585.1 Ig-like domain-containing protein [Brucepastera parasyntrophica]
MKKTGCILLPVVLILIMAGCQNMNDSSIAVTSVTLDRTTLDMALDATEQLTATALPANATNTGIKWSVSSGAAVTVDKQGTVTAVNTGTAVVKAASADDSSKYATCTVTVTNIPVTSVALNKTALTLKLDVSETLGITVLPPDASNPSVTWASSNTQAATVNQQGMVTAVSGGSTVISATSVADSTLTASCTVTVDDTAVYTYSDTSPLIRVDRYSSVEVQGAAGKRMFLVKSNPLSLSVAASSTGSMAGSAMTRNAASYSFHAPSGERIIRYNHAGAEAFSSQPLPKRQEKTQRAVTPSRSYSSGASKSFWVENSNTGVETQITAIVRAVGDNCYIWVPDEYYNGPDGVTDDDKINATQAQLLADKFDFIYPLVTNVFGYEYGGGPNGNGGLIQINVFLFWYMI